MPAAPLPSNEEARLAALHGYGILDTAADPVLDGLVLAAARALDAQIALISLVDRDRQWFKARIGLSVQETPRVQSFCSYLLLGGRTLVVEDARADPRFADNRLVTGKPGIRFYAGAPLIDPAGHRLGSLCAIDLEPHWAEPDEIAELERLARAAMQRIALCGGSGGARPT